MNELKESLFQEIRRATVTGTGIRTTECGSALAARCGHTATSNNVVAAVKELVAEGRLVGVTEKRHDYCWLVPTEHVGAAFKMNESLVPADRIWGLGF